MTRNLRSTSEPGDPVQRPYSRAIRQPRLADFDREISLACPFARRGDTIMCLVEAGEELHVATAAICEAKPVSKAVGRRCVLAAAVLWSLSGVVAKGLDLSPLAIAFYRSLFAGLALIPLVKPSRWVVRPVMVFSAVVFGVMIGAYIAAIKQTTAANAIFLQCSSTFWTVPLGLIFLRERPDPRSVAGIALAMIGVVAIVGWGGGPVREQDAWLGLPMNGGVLLGLVSGFCYAVVVITMRGLRDLDPLWLSAIANLGGSLTIGAWMLVRGESFAFGPSSNLAILAGFGIIQMAIPYALFARGLRELDAPEAGLIGLLEPVLNPLWVFLVHQERPATATILGGLFLLGGVAVRYLPRRRKVLPPGSD